MNTQLGIQLYTVRDDLKKDFEGTLRQVAKIGFDGVEGGHGPLSPSDYKKLCAELKLKPVATGTGTKALEGDKGDAFFKTCNDIGSKYVMIGYEKRDTAEEWIRLGKVLGELGRRAKAAGITLQYHNHAHEFEKYDGKFALDILYEAADPADLCFQVDVGWVQRAGQDPVEWLKKMKGRIKTMHLKDTTGGPDPQWIEVGGGTVPLKPVHEAAQALGVEWYFYEQDTCAGPPLESAAKSYEAARKLLAGQ